MRLLSPNDRVLARRAITSAGILRLVVLTTCADGHVEWEPYDHETPNTVWTNSDIALLRPDAITDFLLDDLQMMLDRGTPLEEIHRYLASSSLLPSPASPALMLSL